VIVSATAPTMPAVSSPAPDFTLPSTAGTDVTLSALRGKNVLIAFFPLAFTSTCTAELVCFTEDFDSFQSEGTMVLPISVDAVPSLREFKGKEQISVELLSDFKREVSRRYGTLLEDKFHTNRSYILIDRNGIVRWTYAEDTPRTRRENSELLERIRALS
jgi:peroxiredoxin